MALRLGEAMVVDEETGKAIGAGVASFVAALWARSFFKRRYARDARETAFDQGEVDLLTRLQAENKLLRERADEAFAERNQAMIELGSLRQKVADLTVHIQRLETQVATMSEELRLMRGHNGR